ncbi:MAG: septum formation initiator family protein [Bacteroidales bacterium]|nr:septum formation initiator family protein [Bacteroidales bacterium]
MSKTDFIEVFKPLLKNKYVITVLGFLLWIAIFDSDNLCYRYSLYQKVNELNQEKARLTRSIEDEKQKMQDLNSSKESLEKFAREEFFMKKDDEVIFIIK